MAYETDLRYRLVGMWTLDEASGTRSDSYGTNHLTDNNTVTQATGKVGNAAQFTRANAEYLSIADNASLSMGDIDFTIACWVRWDTLIANSDGLVTKWGGTANEYALFYNSGASRIAFGVDGGTGLVTVAANALGAPATGTWYFVVAWHDSVANTINIQVNNGTINSAAHAVGVQDSNGTFTLGQIAGQYLDGRLDGVAVWKRTLTSDERAYLYNGGAGQAYPWPVGLAAAPRAYPPLDARTSHTVWLCNPQGYRVQLITDYVSLKYNLGIHGGGGFALELPPNFNPRYLKDYGYAEVWRKVGEQPARLEDVFVVQSIPEAQATGGTRFLTLEGPTVTDFFVLGKNSRVVDALESTTGASYTDNADDVLRKFVQDQLGIGAGNTGAAEGRDLSVYAGFTVEPERGMGPSITEHGYLRPLDEVVRSVVAKSEQNSSAPVRLFPLVRPKSFNPLRFEFVVLPRYFGRYRGFAAAKPVLLSPMLGTIGQVEQEHDRREEWTAVFVTYGSKSGTTRVVDATRRNTAQTAYRETLFDAANSGTEPEAKAEAASKLNEGSPRALARVTLVNSAVTRFGAEYGLGDVVGILALDRRFEAEIAGMDVSRTPGGEAVALKVDEM